MSTASTNGTYMHHLRGMAADYLRRGLPVVPVRFKGKAPSGSEWQTTRVEDVDLDVTFPAGRVSNIGCVLGEPAGHVVDVDLDVPEAVVAARHLLPPTGWRFGRPGNPRSHWLYRVDEAPANASEAFDDPAEKNRKKARLAELRSTGGQTVFPPSVHESGESITWDEFGDPADVTAEDLDRAVCRVAAAALLARRWPGPESGQRQDTFLALAGGLLRGGLSEDETSRFLAAVAEATRDEEALRRVKTVARTAAKQSDGKRTTGWPTVAKMLGEIGPAVVDKVREWLDLRADGATLEGPAPEPPAWPEPPNEAAYHGLAGDIVRAIDPATEADPVAVLVQTLVYFGNRIGRKAHFRVEADRHYANEFVVLMGQSSKARKGTSRGQVQGLFEAADQDGDLPIGLASRSWACERVQSGLSSGEGLIWAVRDPITKDGDTIDEGVEDKRLLAYEPEFANVLKQTERQGNTLSTIIRQAWETGRLRTMTKNSPARATDAHISVVGHITTEELTRYLSATESANGFGNRLTWFAVRRSKLLPEGGAVDGRVMGQLSERLREAIKFAEGVEIVVRDEDARALWHAVYGQLSEGRPGLAGALLGRAEAHVMRFAMLYALLDLSAIIRAEHLLAAVALWDYAERSVLYVFGDSLGNPLADDLARFIRMSAPRGATRTDIQSYLGRHATADRLNQALLLLKTHGIAHAIEEKTSGRSAERWLPGRPPEGR